MEAAILFELHVLRVSPTVTFWLSDASVSFQREAVTAIVSATVCFWLWIQSATDHRGLGAFHARHGFLLLQLPTCSGVPRDVRAPSPMPVRACPESAGLDYWANLIALIARFAFLQLQAVHPHRMREDARAMAGVTRQSQKANLNAKGELCSRHSGFSLNLFSLRKINLL